MLDIQPTPLKGFYAITLDATHDVRGVTRCVFDPMTYATFGLTGHFTGDMFYHGFQGSLRGLYLLPPERHTLLTLVRGDISVVAVDVRPNSRHFRRFHMVNLSEGQTHQVYITGGLAYGVCVRGTEADWQEKYAGFAAQEAPSGVYWQDRDLNIPWPVRFPLVSDADAKLPTLAALVGEAALVNVK